MSVNEFLQKVTKTQMRSTLAILIVSGVFLLVAGLQYRSVPAVNSEIVYMAIGMLMSAFITVVAFYFGASKNETDKQKAELEESK